MKKNINPSDDNLALVVIAVLDENKTKIHEHKVYGQIPNDESGRIRFTLDVDDSLRKLNGDYPEREGYVIQVIEEKNFVPLRKTLKLVEYW